MVSFDFLPSESIVASWLELVARPSHRFIVDAGQRVSFSSLLYGSQFVCRSLEAAFDFVKLRLKYDITEYAALDSISSSKICKR